MYPLHFCFSLLALTQGLLLTFMSASYACEPEVLRDKERQANPVSYQALLKEAQSYENPEIHVAYLTDKREFDLPFKRLDRSNATDEQEYKRLKSMRARFPMEGVDKEEDEGFIFLEESTLPIPVPDVIVVYKAKENQPKRKYLFEMRQRQNDKLIFLQGASKNLVSFLKDTLGMKDADTLTSFKRTLLSLSWASKDDYKMLKKAAFKKEKATHREWYNNNEKEKKALKTQLKELQDYSAKLADKQAALYTRLETLEHEKVSLTSRINQVTEQNDTLIAHSQMLAKQLDNLNEQITQQSQLVLQKEQEKSTLTSEWQQEKATLLMRVQGTDGEKAQLTRVLATRVQELQTLQQRIQGLEEEKAQLIRDKDLQVQARTREIQEFQQRIQALAAEQQRLTRELTTRTQENQMLEQRIQTLDAEKERLTRELARPSVTVVKVIQEKKVGETNAIYDTVTAVQEGTITRHAKIRKHLTRNITYYSDGTSKADGWVYNGVYDIVGYCF